MSEIITEKEVADPVGATYVNLYVDGENKKGDKLMVRNTTPDRLQFRIGGEDSNTFTVSPGEKMLIGGFEALQGNRIEVKAVSDVTESIRLNIYS